MRLGCTSLEESFESIVHALYVPVRQRLRGSSPVYYCGMPARSSLHSSEHLQPLFLVSRPRSTNLFLQSCVPTEHTLTARASPFRHINTPPRRGPLVSSSCLIRRWTTSWLRLPRLPYLPVPDTRYFSIQLVAVSTASLVAYRPHSQWSKTSTGDLPSPRLPLPVRQRLFARELPIQKMATATCLIALILPPTLPALAQILLLALTAQDRLLVSTLLMKVLSRELASDTFIHEWSKRARSRSLG